LEALFLGRSIILIRRRRKQDVVAVAGKCFDRRDKLDLARAWFDVEVAKLPRRD
jgi:hypothetical protein